MIDWKLTLTLTLEAVVERTLNKLLSVCYQYFFFIRS